MANTGTNLPVNRGRISASHPGAGTVAAPPPPSSGPTLLYNDLRNMRDASVITRRGVESFNRSDLPVIRRNGIDLINRSDITQYTLSNTVPQSRNQQDVGIITITLTAQPRGQVDGNADHDDWGDAWTDNTVGNTGVNHGNVSPLSMTSGVAGLNVNLAWIEINLTRFTGFTATGDSHTITGTFTNGNALLAQTITLSGGPSPSGGGATRPFTESTITQSNQPATPTSFVLTQNLAAAATNVTLTFTLTDAQMNTIIGNWALLQFVGNAGATPDTMVSREGSAGQRMTLTFTAKRQ